MFLNPNSNKGISVVEILVIVAIIGITLISVLGLATFSLEASHLVEQTNRARDLAQEAIEAVRSFRDGTDWESDGLSTLSTEADYYPKKDTSVSPPRWQLIGGVESIGIFKRKINFYQVQRDGNGNIVESGGTVDPDTLKMKVTVSWKEREFIIVTYLTNWRQ
jgi:type II secretory pathway pseudopilin PulG